MFDIEPLTTSLQLTALNRFCASSRLIGNKLKEIQRQFPDVQRPLSELTLILDGRTLLVRRADGLIEPGGQLRIDFDAFGEDESDDRPATLPSPAIFLSRATKTSDQPPTSSLTSWAADLDET